MTTQPSLIIKLWGVRGSVPTPLSAEDIHQKQAELLKRLCKDGGSEKLFGNPAQPEKMEQWLHSLPFSMTGTYGGNTTCFEVRGQNSPLIMIDAGTGARLMGVSLLKRLVAKQALNPLNTVKASERDIHLFFSHYHWDHLQGFPFFGPAFTYGPSKINFIFYGRRDAKQHLSDVLGGQQECPNFPVAWEDMPCNKTFVELGRLEPHPVQIGETTVTYQELTHPDSVFGYAFTCNGKRFVYATDTEHRDIPDPRLLKLAKDADYLYYDSQYSPSEYRGDPGSLPGPFHKFDWGHSTYEWAIKSALAANVKAVLLGHHEPIRNDFQLESLLAEAVAFRNTMLAKPEYAGRTLDVQLAKEGLEIVL